MPKFESTANSFIKENINTITSWDLKKIEPLLTPEFNVSLNSDKGRKIYCDVYSKLGNLSSVDQVKYLGRKTRVDLNYGIYQVFHYALMTTFEKEKAVINISLSTSGNPYSIYYFTINFNGLKKSM